MGVRGRKDPALRHPPVSGWDFHIHVIQLFTNVNTGCFAIYVYEFFNTGVTGQPSSAAIIRAGQKNTKRNTSTFHKIYKKQIFEWFPSLGRLRVSLPALGNYGETKHINKSYIKT